MSTFSLTFLSISLGALIPSVFAQERGRSPFGAYECASKVAFADSTSSIAQYVQSMVSDGQLPILKADCAADISAHKDTEGNRANWFLFIAELMKSIGSPKASDYYVRAIDTDSNEAGHHLFYGDYLRNFRGPQEPLFPEAERQYFLGQQTVARVRRPELCRPWDKEVASRIQRSIVALHQRDGVALVFRRSGMPALFFSSVFRLAQANADLDRTSDVRDYTSAAAFAQSAQRKGAPLTHGELRSMIRVEAPVESFDRLRVRYGNGPVLDLRYNFRRTSDAAITIYNPPFTFNRVHLNEIGLSLEKPFTVGHGLDMAVGGSFQQSWRQGLVEYLPNAIERINQFEGKVSLSRFVGRDKFNASVVYVYQALHPDVIGNPNRERLLLAPRLSYQVFRPSTFGEHFQTRGIELFAGALLDRETYPATPGSLLADTLVKRRDYFGGIAARGLGAGRWDVTLQPTFFSSIVKPDRTQNNSQYRTSLVALYRIVDEERHPGIPDYEPGRSSGHLAFLHIVVPISHDVTRDGIDAFRNYKAGAELDAMLYTTARSGVSFLASARYDFQRFYVLKKNQNLLTISLSMGF